MKYYDDYDHYGYNIHGEKLEKVLSSKDEMERFLEKEEDPTSYWRTVYDTVNQCYITLNTEQYNLLKSLLHHTYPYSYNPYQVLILSSSSSSYKLITAILGQRL